MFHAHAVDHAGLAICRVSALNLVEMFTDMLLPQQAHVLVPPPRSLGSSLSSIARDSQTMCGASSRCDLARENSRHEEKCTTIFRASSLVSNLLHLSHMAVCCAVGHDMANDGSFDQATGAIARGVGHL
jgi:hypothetical protein